MSYHDAGNSTVLDGLYHVVLRLRIQRGCGFIHNDDGGILRQNAGDPDADVEFLRALQETLEKVHEQH